MGLAAGIYSPCRSRAICSQEDYSTTIIGVPDKSYIWIMARTPTVDQAPSKFEA